jgi:VCBS repeat-containing protein
MNRYGFSPLSRKELGSLWLSLLLCACQNPVSGTSNTVGNFQPGVTTVSAESLAISVAEDATYSTLLPASSTRVGDSLTFSVVSGVSHGSLTFDSGLGLASYQPNSDYHGADSFSFTASNGTETSEVATVLITITPVNDAPVATADTLLAAQDMTSIGQLAGTDVDGDSLVFAAASNPANGTLVLSSDGSYTYAPGAGYSGADSFTFTVSDGTATSAAATVLITVDPTPNSGPVADDDAVSTNESSAFSGNATASDADSDPLTYSKVTDPANGTLSFAADGSYTYTPDAGFHGSDSFTFKSNDGTSDSNTSTITVTVNPILTISSSQAGISVTSRFSYAISGTCTRNGVNVALSLTRGATTVTGTAACNGATYSGTITTGYTLTDGAVTIGAEYASAPLAARTASVTKSSGCTGNSCNSYLDNSGGAMALNTDLGGSTDTRYTLFRSTTVPTGTMLGDATGTIYLRDRTYALTYRLGPSWSIDDGALVSSGVSPAVSEDGSKVAFAQYSNQTSTTISCNNWDDSSNANGHWDNATEGCAIYTCDTSNPANWMDVDWVGDGSGFDATYTEGQDTCYTRRTDDCHQISGDDGDGVWETTTETCYDYSYSDTTPYRYLLKSYNRTTAVTQSVLDLTETYSASRDNTLQTTSEAGSLIHTSTANMKEDGTRIVSVIGIQLITQSNGVGTSSSYSMTERIRGHALTFNAGSTAVSTSVLATHVSAYDPVIAESCSNASPGTAYNNFSGSYIGGRAVSTNAAFTSLNYALYTYSSYSESNYFVCDTPDMNNCNTYTDLNSNGHWDNQDECGNLSCSNYSDDNSNFFWDAGTESCSIADLTCGGVWSDTDFDAFAEGPTETCTSQACITGTTYYSCDGSNVAGSVGTTLTWN